MSDGVSTNASNKKRIAPAAAPAAAAVLNVLRRTTVILPKTHPTWSIDEAAGQSVLILTPLVDFSIIKPSNNQKNDTQAAVRPQGPNLNG